MNNFIETCWKSCGHVLVPEGADEVQKENAKLAFYLSAWAVVNHLKASESGEQLLDRLKDVYEELDSFGKLLEEQLGDL